MATTKTTKTRRSRPGYIQQAEWMDSAEFLDLSDGAIMTLIGSGHPRAAAAREYLDAKWAARQADMQASLRNAGGVGGLIQGRG